MFFSENFVPQVLYRRSCERDIVMLVQVVRFYWRAQARFETDQRMARKVSIMDILQLESLSLEYRRSTVLFWCA